ncbi:hypothetical protein E2562_031216 [Oryza meyeriana var. granulata]|uniref:F-box associated beta-propeller type 1 domain-containing protein n=1 Tax=Oryza meyeriana var. granulata TaxID=110450 RepID=A0A6G1DR71_9ORYZ|nr:hypothetical protein E2562_031216 [Oryza meyeriana var. granulata]
MFDYPHPSRDYAIVGLGYDARTRTHKAVRLLYHDGQPASRDVYDIAGASSTGHWRPAATGAKPPDLVHMNKLAVYAQGHLHWITTKGHDEADAIISFSMLEEEFGFVPPPPGTTDMKDLQNHGARRMSMRLLGVPPHAGEISGHLLRCRIDPTKPVTSPEMNVFFVSKYHQVAEYHAASGTLRGLGPEVQRHCGAASLPQLVPYMENLMSAGRPYEDTLFSPSPSAQALALHRQPARTLGRLKHVCRRWRAIIETDRFAASHNTHVKETMAAGRSVGHVRLLSCYYLSKLFVSLESCLGYPKPPLMKTRTVCRKACHGLVLVTSVNRETNTVHNPVTGADRNFSFLSPQWSLVGDAIRDKARVVADILTQPKVVELVVPMAIDAGDSRILLDSGKTVGYYDAQKRTLEAVFSLSLNNIRFTLAAIAQDSLVRPYHRGFRYS